MSEYPGFAAAAEIGQGPEPSTRGPVPGTGPQASDPSQGDRWPLRDTIALVSLASALLWSIIFATVVRLIG